MSDFFLYLLTLNVGAFLGFFLASLLAANVNDRRAATELIRPHHERGRAR